MPRKIEIDKEKFKQQILDGMTISELMEQWNCGRTKITDAKRKWGFVGLSPNSKPRDNGNGTKTCNICMTSKPLSEFYSNGYDTKGNKKIKPSCKPCENGKHYKVFLSKLMSIVHELGLEYKCEICGYDENFAALTFHHYSDKKNFEISNGRSFSREKLLEEILLCKLLCQNCHHRIHNPHLDKSEFC